MDQTLIVSRSYRVSVLLSVYNASDFLLQSINSILDQTFTDFEFLIIDDASTDDSYEKLRKISDERIRLFRNVCNKGIVSCLNHLLSEARGEYVIRMDADDFAYSNRIQKQVEFMDENPDVDICGSWFKIMGTNQIIEHPISHEDCLKRLFTGTCLGHPTVILRLERFRNKYLYYPSDAKYAEDYSLWVDAAISGLRFANLSLPLLEYRIHDNQTSSKYLITQNESVNYIQAKMINSCLNYLSAKEKMIFLRMFSLDIRRLSEIRDLVVLRNKVLKKKFQYIEFTERYLDDSFFSFSIYGLLIIYFKSKLYSIFKRFFLL